MDQHSCRGIGMWVIMLAVFHCNNQNCDQQVAAFQTNAYLETHGAGRNHGVGGRRRSFWTRRNLFFYGPKRREEQRSSVRFTRDNPLALPLKIDLSPSPKSRETNFLTLEEASTTRHLRSMVDICVTAYGSGPAVFTWTNPGLWIPYLGRLKLAVLIELSFRAKLLYKGRDYLMLVLTAPATTSTSAASTNVIGMVEVSRQPPICSRNPPPFPDPFKELMWGDNDTQGWITNLLVIPDFRGRGLGKILVSACESVARDIWGRQSIHLHCDADSLGVKYFYTSQGYDTGTPVVIGGIDLIYLGKDLDKKVLAEQPKQT